MGGVDYHVDFTALVIYLDYHGRIFDYFDSVKFDLYRSNFTNF